jgi:uncharacterized repeat protein (TIGR01451 family)
MAKRRSFGLVLVVALFAGLGVIGAPQLASAVVQDGPNNFAGPAAQCPGTGWDCTTNTTSVEQTTNDGMNIVVCRGATCNATQHADGGSNHVTCNQSATAASTQRCTYIQTNTGGQNIAEVTQKSTLTNTNLRINVAGLLNSILQKSVQEVDGKQQNTTGANQLELSQAISQSSSGLIAVNDAQLAQQKVVHEQTSTTGDQSATLDQVETLSQTGLGLGASQKQNATNVGPNTLAQITQHTTDGDNQASVDQTETLTQAATSIVGAVAQTQGVEGGGEQLVWDVESTNGNSHVGSDQIKNWTQSATHVLPVGTTTQKQIDRLGILGLPFTTHTSEVSQKTNLVADPGAQQVCTQQVDIFNKVDGTATQNCTIDDRQGEPETTTETTSGTHIESTNECTSADCNPADDPDSDMHKAVRNVSNEEGYDGAEHPTSTGAVPGDTIEYKLTYENAGGGPASDVVVTDAAPANTTFVSCSDSCNQEGSLSWNLGTVEAGAPVERTFRVTVNEGTSSGTTIPNTASADSAEEDAVTSNQTSVTVGEAATTGTISGTVTDAQNPETAIEGVLVQTGDSSDTTDASGEYELTGLAPGHYAVQASKTGYSTTELETDVTAGGTSTLDFSLSAAQATNEYRVVLTWGTDPTDLDAHLWLPSDTPYHILYNRKGTTDGCPNAQLDVDDTNGEGPETTTIVDPFAGSYRFGVHKFGGSATLAASGATVQLYKGDELLQTFSVPTTGGAGDNWWHVFDLDAQTGTVTTVDQLMVGDAGSAGNNTQPPAPYADSTAGCATISSLGAPDAPSEGGEKE